MAEDYEFIYQKLGELISDSNRLVDKRQEILEVYSVSGEIEGFFEKYLSGDLSDKSIPNLGENLENYVLAAFDYYDSLIEKQNLLKVFKELSPPNDFQNSQKNFRRLSGNLEEEILEVRDSLNIATANSFLLELLRKINNY